MASCAERWARQAAARGSQLLKTGGILVRYMNYPEWGDGLRITVGTDEQTAVLVELLESLIG